MSNLDDIKAERQKVYGDPRENHKGIAMAWAGLLQPHADRIARGEPIPEWLVVLLICAIKMNRMRRVYHQDNYDDLRVYLNFAEEWQADKPVVKQERIYVGGPYSAPTLEERELNVTAAVRAATECMRRGHLAHCPHSATHPIEQMDQGQSIGYEDYMDLDFSLIDNWATAFLYTMPSPGTDRELARSEARGLKIYRSVEEVPCLATSLNGSSDQTDSTTPKTTLSTPSTTTSRECGARPRFLG